MNLKKLTLMILLSGTMVSCIKGPAEEEQVPATAEAVATSLGEAWGQSDPLTMSANDFLAQDTEQKIDGATEPFFVLQEGITISSKEERDTDYLYTFLYQTREVKQGQNGAESTREAHKIVGKPDPAAATVASVQKSEIRSLAEDYQLTLGIEKLIGLANACAKSDAMDKYCVEKLGYDSCDITCTNLKSFEETLPVPQAIKDQENCGGFANCSYKVKRVQFDWTIALKKGASVEKQKVNYSVAVSPDMPFLARVTEYCFKQLYTVQNQKLLVNTCTKLKNFKKGGS